MYLLIIFWGTIIILVTNWRRRHERLRGLNRLLVLIGGLWLGTFLLAAIVVSIRGITGN